MAVLLGVAGLGLAAMPGCASERQRSAAPAASEGELVGDTASTNARSDDESDDHLSPRERLERKMAERRGDVGMLPTVELGLEQLATGHLVVPATANGKRYRFILDTGASTSVMTPATREALGLAEDDGMAVQASGANGEVSDVRLMTVAELEVGGRAYRELTMAVMDLGHLEAKLESSVDGILGRNFLMRNDVEIDFVAGKLRMFEPGSIESGALSVAEMDVVPYQSFPAGLIRIDVELDDKVTMPAVFDLGAGRSVLNWRAAKAAGLDPADANLEKGEDLVGADDRTMPTSRHRFARLVAGALEVRGPTLHIADLEVFDTLGVGERPAMVFGLDMVDDRRVVLDYGDQRIYFSRIASTAQPAKPPRPAKPPKSARAPGVRPPRSSGELTACAACSASVP